MNPLPYGHKTFGDEQYKNNTSAFSVSARYTGQVLDEDTGLYYYGARYYDPQLARFIQPDPIVPEELNSQALNRYSYCINNPLKFTDPTGQSFWSAVAAIVNWLTSAKVATAIVVAAAVGAGMAAATGGDVLKGALAGAIGGMFGVGFNPVMAMAGGAVGALVTGGDPMMGALSAGIAAGVGACFEGSPLPGVFGDVENDYFSALMFSTASGALCGGVTAEIFGGDFGSGALEGAASAAAAFVLTCAVYDHVDETPASDWDWANPKPLEVSFASEQEPLYLMSYLGSENRLERGEKYSWWVWTKDIVKGTGEGLWHGAKIAVLHDSKTAQRYGSIGTASNVCGYVSDGAFAVAGGLSIIGKAAAKRTIATRVAKGFSDGATCNYIKTTSRITGRTMKVVQKVTTPAGKVVHKHAIYKRFWPF